MVSRSTRSEGYPFIMLLTIISLLGAYRMAGGETSPSILWNVTFDSKVGGVSVNDFARGVALGPDGNPVVTGISGSDFSTVKYDASTGAILWTATFPSGPNLGSRAVAVGPDGNPVVTGSAGPEDFLTVKYDGATGNILWTATFDARGVDRAFAVAIGPDGNPVITGISCGPFFGPPNCDFLTVKYNGSNGTILWNVSFDSSSQDFVRGVAVGPDGNPVVVGQSAFTDVRIIKYDGAGRTILWDVTYNNIIFGTSEEQGWGIAVGLDGNPVVTGNSRGGSNQNVRTVKLNGSTGAILWNTIFGSAVGEEAKSVAVGPDGNPVVTGSVNPSGSTDDDNFLTIKYDGSTGAILWNVTFDTGGKDVAFGVAVGTDGNPVVTGETRQLGPGFDFLTIKYVQQLTVSIDIRPGSDPNSINPRSEGTIPVAVLTTDSFDATTIDPNTVLFGPTGTEAAPVHAALEDVDLDGDTDMILHFNTQDTGIVCGDASATLTGETFSGQMIQGSDSINTAGCK